MLGDITLAEPGALIGFAGRRVIEQTIGQVLAQGASRAPEFAQEKGFVDAIVKRNDLKDTLRKILAIHREVSGCDEGRGMASGGAGAESEAPHSEILHLAAHGGLYRIARGQGVPGMTAPLSAASVCSAGLP